MQQHKPAASAAETPYAALLARVRGAVADNSDDADEATAAIVRMIAAGQALNRGADR